MVYGLICSAELWMHLGSWESIGLRYRLEQLLRLLRALQTFCVGYKISC